MVFIFLAYFTLYHLSQLFESGGQSIGTSGLVLPLNIQCWFPLGLTGFISFNPKDSQDNFQHHCVKASVLQCSDFFMVHIHIHTWLLEKSYLWIYSHSFGKVMSLLFNMLSSFLITFLPRSKHLFISWLQSSSSLIMEPKKIKHVRPIKYLTQTFHQYKCG